MTSNMNSPSGSWFSRILKRRTPSDSSILSASSTVANASDSALPDSAVSSTLTPASLSPASISSIPFSPASLSSAPDLHESNALASFSLTLSPTPFSPIPFSASPSRAPSPITPPVLISCSVVDDLPAVPLTSAVKARAASLDGNCVNPSSHNSRKNGSTDRVASLDRSTATRFPLQPRQVLFPERPHRGTNKVAVSKPASNSTKANATSVKEHQFKLPSEFVLPRVARHVYKQNHYDARPLPIKASASPALITPSRTIEIRYRPRVCKPTLSARGEVEPKSRPASILRKVSASSVTELEYALASKTYSGNVEIVSTTSTRSTLDSIEGSMFSSEPARLSLPASITPTASSVLSTSASSVPINLNVTGPSENISSVEISVIVAPFESAVSSPLVRPATPAALPLDVDIELPALEIVEPNLSTSSSTPGNAAHTERSSSADFVSSVEAEASTRSRCIKGSKALIAASRSTYPLKFARQFTSQSSGKMEKASSPGALSSLRPIIKCSSARKRRPVAAEFVALADSVSWFWPDQESVLEKSRDSVTPCTTSVATESTVETAFKELCSLDVFGLWPELSIQPVKMPEYNFNVKEKLCTPIKAQIPSITEFPAAIEIILSKTYKGSSDLHDTQKCFYNALPCLTSLQLFMTFISVCMVIFGLIGFPEMFGSVAIPLPSIAIIPVPNSGSSELPVLSCATWNAYCSPSCELSPPNTDAFALRKADFTNTYATEKTELIRDVTVYTTIPETKPPYTLEPMKSENIHTAKIPQTSSAPLRPTSNSAHSIKPFERSHGDGALSKVGDCFKQATTANLSVVKTFVLATFRMIFVGFAAILH